MEDFRKEQILSVRRKKKRMRKIVLSALVVFFCSLIGFNLYINESFGITYYTVCSEKIGSDIRAVLLADLHCKEYGHKNEKLVEAIAEQKPVSNIFLRRNDRFYLFLRYEGFKKIEGQKKRVKKNVLSKYKGGSYEKFIRKNI